MKEYIGTKIVQAEPAWRITAEDGCEFVHPKSNNNDFAASGKIEDGYKVVYQDGYESWSPKDVFEAAYRETACMTPIARILCGDKEALVDEIYRIVKWARERTAKEWWNMTHDSDSGLPGVIRRIVENNLTIPTADETSDKASDKR